MIEEKLGHEFASLIHYVELNRAGWWDKAMQELVVAALWTADQSLSDDDIAATLRDQYNIRVATVDVSTHLARMCATGVLVCLPDGHFKIAEAARRKMESEMTAMQNADAAAADSFKEALAVTGLVASPQTVWDEFNSLMLTPLVLESGAKTYELFTGGSAGVGSIKELGRFLEHYPQEMRPAVRSAVLGFMDAKNAAARAYVLRRMNARFLVTASGLGEKTMQMLSNASATPASFIVFLDTNFLFSVLGLHENPSNEAAERVIEVIHEMRGNATAKLYVLPPTVIETKRVIGAVLDSLRGLRLTANMAEAALQTNLGGLTQRFVAEASRVGPSLTPESYFEPYVSNLVTVLRTKGVELYNQKVDEYESDQRVVDDIMAGLEASKGQGGKAKSYEQLSHDMILWHFVEDKRQPYVESPLSAVYWIATVDYGLLVFDARKKRASGSSVPVCLHPTALVQMLQFWVPRSHKLEEAIFSAIRLPFLFHEFDVEAEKVTVRILKTLGRYENVGDLSKETVLSVLLNDALRQKISREPDTKRSEELVREAVIDENRQTKQQLAEARRANLSIAADADARDKAAAAETQRLARALAQRDAEKVELLETLKKQTSQIATLDSETSNLREMLEAKSKADAHSEATRRFGTIYVAAFGAAVLILGIVGYFLMPAATKRFIWQFRIAFWMTLLFVWLWLLDAGGRRDAEVADTSLFHAFQRFRKYLFWLVGAVLTGAIGSAVWSWCAPMLTKTP